MNWAYNISQCLTIASGLCWADRIAYYRGWMEGRKDHISGRRVLAHVLYNQVEISIDQFNWEPGEGKPWQCRTEDLSLPLNETDNETENYAAQ